MGHADPAPPARGELTATPFAHLVLYLYRRGDNGTLAIDEGERGESSVVFRKGRPIAARFAVPSNRILPGLLRLCGLRAGHYEFDPEDRLGGDAHAVRGAVDPYALVSAARERHTRDDVVDDVLQRYANTKLRLQPGREIGRLQLSTEDAVVLDLLRAGPARIDELVVTSPRPARTTRHLLYTLIVTHMVQSHEDAAGSSRSAVRARATTPSTPASAGEDGSVRGRRPSFKTVNAVAGATPNWQRLASLRPGAMSSRPPTGGPASAPPRSAQPSGAPTAGPSSGAPTAGPSSRAPATGPSTSLAPPPDAPAHERFVHAERLLEQGRFADVVALADDLIREDEGHAAYHALRALALFRQTRENATSLPRTVVDATRRALQLDDEEPRGLFTRGLILKRAGDLRRALASFQRAARADPSALDVKREILLARRRLGKDD